MATQIVFIYSVTFHIMMQYLNYIFLNFHCKILNIERVVVNLEKKLFAVRTITRNRIIVNEKVKMHLLEEKFLEVTAREFFSGFRNFW